MIRSGQCKGQPAFIYVLPVSFITQYRSDYSLCLEPGRELSLSVEKDKTKTGRDEMAGLCPCDTTVITGSTFILFQRPSV